MQPRYRLHGQRNSGNMKEKLIEKKLREKAKKRGGLAIKIYCLSFSGLPDRLVLLPKARIGFAEIKETGKKPSPIQVSVISMLKKMGFIVEVIDTEEKIEDFLNAVQA